MKWLFALSVLTVAALLPDLSAIAPLPVSEQKVSLKDLPDCDNYKADPYLAVAATLQAVEKEKAAVILTHLAKVEVRNGDQGRRVPLLCRMLFKARPNGEFRPPSLGFPVFVGLTEFIHWPLEPIELVDGIPFLVVSGYVVGGYPELAGNYLDYCVRNCDWNTEAFKPKTGEQKRKALAKLVASPRWKEPLTAEAKKLLSSQIE